jgi:hypothetical protein
MLSEPLPSPSRGRGSLSRIGRDRALETDSGLKLDDSAGQARRGAPEIQRLIDLRARGAKLKGRQIQRVEKVEEVGSQFQIGRLAQAQGGRQPDVFREAQIRIAIVRSSKRIAADSRRSALRNIEVGGGSERKIAARNDVAGIAVIGASAIGRAEVGDGTRGRKRWAARRLDGLAAATPLCRAVKEPLTRSSTADEGAVEDHPLLRGEGRFSNPCLLPAAYCDTPFMEYELSTRT